MKRNANIGWTGLTLGLALLTSLRVAADLANRAGETKPASPPKLAREELDAIYTNKLYISGQKVFDWLDETGPQQDIAIAEKG
jgi:hypothetical protein